MRRNIKERTVPESYAVVEFSFQLTVIYSSEFPVLSSVNDPFHQFHNASKEKGF